MPASTRLAIMASSILPSIMPRPSAFRPSPRSRRPNAHLRGHSLRASRHAQTFALEEAVAALEGGYRSIAVPSGLAAITISLLAFLQAGDHLLMVDTTYPRSGASARCDAQGPRYRNHLLRSAGRPGVVDARTARVVYLESPGSLTFEVQDVPRAVAAARSAGAVSIIDNTWSAGSISALSARDRRFRQAQKYIVGHSDVMLGVITTNEDRFLRVKRASSLIGSAAGPDDCYLALRGCEL